MSYGIVESNYNMKCRFMDLSHDRDENGHVIETWVPGPEFMAAFSKKDDGMSRIADQLGTKAEYTITTGRETVLKFPQVIRREDDGKYFRIKESGVDNKTPDSSDLNMRIVKAEEWNV